VVLRGMFSTEQDITDQRGHQSDLRVGHIEGTESAGINRHIVGDERALRKRRSDSILASSLACDLARGHSEA
jgi:hypothetical protein